MSAGHPQPSNGRLHDPLFILITRDIPITRGEINLWQKLPASAMD